MELVGVTKRFGPVVATDDVSFAIRKGGMVALLGPSGCGKTTILRMIAGFEQPTQGMVRIAGQDVAGRRPYERSVGILFQQYALFPHLTVSGNIGYGLRHRGWPRAQRSRRIHEMLKLVRLDGFGHRFPSELSGGQQQRVALARALATEPDVVLLDEPLSALDAKLRQTLRMELKEILGAVSATVLLVTHDQEEAMSFAERIFVMNRGRIEQAGSSTDLYFRPRTRFVAEFLGRSNWIDGVALAESSGAGDVVRSPLGTLLKLPRGAMTTPLADICVRPERIELLQAGRQESEAALLPGRVLESIHVGADDHVLVRTAEGDFTAFVRSRDGGGHAPGTTVWLRIRPEDCIVLGKTA